MLFYVCIYLYTLYMYVYIYFLGWIVDIHLLLVDQGKE